MQLVAQRIASETRVGEPDSMTLNSLQETTSLNPKSLSPRLSELSKAGFVTRETIEDKTKFRMTTIGIEWLSTVLNRTRKPRNVQVHFLTHLNKLVPSGSLPSRRSFLDIGITAHVALAEQNILPNKYL